MATSLEMLLAPISDEAPAGPDLAYDPERHAIEQVFEASVSIDASGIVEQRPEPDWRQLLAKIAGLAGRTKDLWLAVYYCRAGAEAGRLDQVELGIAFPVGLLDRYWESMHPQLEEYGIEARKSAFDSLASAQALAGPLRRVVYAEHARLGRITGEDIERFHRGGEAEEGYGMFRAMLADDEVREALDAGVARIARIEVALRGIDARLMEEAGARNATDFSAVYDVLSTQQIALRSFLPTPHAAEPEAAMTADDAHPEGADGERSAAGGVRNREDVARMLGLVLDYYRRHEPSSPVPLLIERARSWIGLDFMRVLEDIAPGAMGDAQVVFRARNGE